MVLLPCFPDYRSDSISPLDPAVETLLGSPVFRLEIAGIVYIYREMHVWLSPVSPECACGLVFAADMWNREIKKIVILYKNPLFPHLAGIETTQHHLIRIIHVVNIPLHRGRLFFIHTPDPAA